MNNPCEHKNFIISGNVYRLQLSATDERIGGYTVDVRVRCADCNLPFEWIGIPCGYLSDRPASSVDFQELRAPILPKGELAPGVPRRLNEMQRMGLLHKKPPCPAN